MRNKKERISVEKVKNKEEIGKEITRKWNKQEERRQGNEKVDSVRGEVKR